MWDTRAKLAAAPDVVTWRRAIGPLIAALVSFVLTAGLWELAVNRLHARPDMPEPFNTKIEAYFEGGGYDTVFIGSSRYAHGLDPAAFDAEMRRLGVPTHSFNLGFDAMSFHELRFVAAKVLADPRSHLKYLFVEPSLRERIAPGLENSQRELLLHDSVGSAAILQAILEGNQSWDVKLFWFVEHARVSLVRLTNVGALSNRFIRREEPAPDAAELIGPSGNGYSALSRLGRGGVQTSAEDIRRLVTAQSLSEQSGDARRLNAYEISEWRDLKAAADARGVELILLAPPTAAAEPFGEFAAISRAAKEGSISAPTLSFADPFTYFDLYDPAGFVDPDHVDAQASRRWSTAAADAFAKMLAEHR